MRKRDVREMVLRVCDGNDVPAIRRITGLPYSVVYYHLQQLIKDKQVEPTNRTIIYKRIVPPAGGMQLEMEFNTP